MSEPEAKTTDFEPTTAEPPAQAEPTPRKERWNWQGPVSIAIAVVVLISFGILVYLIETTPGPTTAAALAERFSKRDLMQAMGVAIGLFVGIAGFMIGLVGIFVHENGRGRDALGMAMNLAVSLAIVIYVLLGPGRPH